MKKAEPNTNKTEISAPAAAGLASTVAPVAAKLTPEQIEELKSRAARADENWDRLLRTTADLENFKKRAARERMETAQFAAAALIEKLLPVLDHFEMAQAAAQNAGDDKLASLQAGVAMIQQQLKTALTETGVEEIDATGKTFDPALHQAVSQRETSEMPEGHVFQQLRKGYKLRDRLLRPATVIVAKKPAANAK
jgi:molecular chaperone GrpE